MITLEKLLKQTTRENNDMDLTKNNNVNVYKLKDKIEERKVENYNTNKINSLLLIILLDSINKAEDLSHLKLLINSSLDVQIPKESANIVSLFCHDILKDEVCIPSITEELRQVLTKE